MGHLCESPSHTSSADSSFLPIESSGEQPALNFLVGVDSLRPEEAKVGRTARCTSVGLPNETPRGYSHARNATNACDESTRAELPNEPN